MSESIALLCPPMTANVPAVWWQARGSLPLGQEQTLQRYTKFRTSCTSACGNRHAHCTQAFLFVECRIFNYSAIFEHLILFFLLVFIAGLKKILYFCAQHAPSASRKNSAIRGSNLFYISCKKSHTTNLFFRIRRKFRCLNRAE